VALATVQVHPAPLIFEADKPVGNESVTVALPMLGPEPEFETLTVYEPTPAIKVAGVFVKLIVQVAKL
jgi:hypothetical protein